MTARRGGRGQGQEARDPAPALPGPPAPKDGDRTATPLPPEAVRPFLDALAEMLCSYVVSKFTVGPGTRPDRNPEGPTREGFDEGSMTPSVRRRRVR